MNAAWFEGYIRSVAALPWTPAEVRSVATDLQAIASLNQGDVYEDVPIRAAWVREQALEAVVGSLDRLARKYAQQIRPAARPWAVVKTNAFAVDRRNLTPSTLIPKLDINSAALAPLAALPGIGRTVAGRIAESREREGAFGSMADLSRVKGVGAREVAALSERAYVARPDGRARYSGADGAAFLEKPTFANYVTFLRNGGPRLALYSDGSAADLKEHLSLEIAGLRQEETQSVSHPFRSPPGVLASQVREARAARRRASALDRGAISAQTYAVLLENSAYPYFLLDMIGKARRTIRIVMFFMRFLDKKKYPTDDLLQALVAARARHVDVKIILDRDAVGAVIGSRIVNEEAFRFLRRNRIPVVYDALTRYTHTKLVTVDGNHVVVGSHNWTAGSFFAYDDKSVYVRSAALAQHYDAEFDRFWADYRHRRA